MEKKENETDEPKDNEIKKRQTQYGCRPCEAQLCMLTYLSIYHSVINLGVIPSKNAATGE